MGELVVSHNELELVNALYSTDSEAALPMPFERDIFLIGTQVAGTSHIIRMPELYERLKVDDPVVLVREPDNPFDEYAIRIETADRELLGRFPSHDAPSDSGDKLGYMPQINNRIIARLMDAGKLIYGVVRHKEIVDGRWHKIVVKVYMKE